MRARPFVFHLLFREAIADAGGDRRETVAQRAGRSADGPRIHLRHAGIGTIIHPRNDQVRRRLFHQPPQAKIHGIRRRAREAVALVSHFLNIERFTRFEGYR